MSKEQAWVRAAALEIMSYLGPRMSYESSDIAAIISKHAGTPHPEQNTQRPELFNCVEHCAYKDGCHPVQSHPLCPSCAEWYRIKFFQLDSPAPQTEAVDVEWQCNHEKGNGAGTNIYQGFELIEALLETPIAERIVSCHNHVVKPLTQRIAVLEKEIEQLRADLKMKGPDRNNW